MSPSPIYWFQDGGFSMWLILLGDLLLAAVFVLMAAVSVNRGRISRGWAAALFGGGASLGALGAAGWWLGMVQLRRALAGASSDVVAELTEVGSAYARRPLWFGAGSGLLWMGLGAAVLVAAHFSAPAQSAGSRAAGTGSGGSHGG